MKDFITVKSLGENIAKTRRQRKLSQEQLAELAGISANYLARIERGEVKGFSAINLLKISQALHVSVEDLLKDSVKPKSAPTPKPNQLALNTLLDKMDDRKSEKLSRLFVRTIKTLSK